MSAERHITPRVSRHLRDALATIEAKRRVSYERCALVLRACCRWARCVDGEGGVWRCSDTIGQLAENAGLERWVVTAALDNLAEVGLVVTVAHGGGRGALSRGSIRHLLLDPVDKMETARGYPAQFQPKLRGVNAETARGNGETPRGQPRDTVFHPLEHPRDHPAEFRVDDGDTTPAWFAERMNRALAPTALADKVMPRERFIENKRRAMARRLS